VGRRKSARHPSLTRIRCLGMPAEGPPACGEPVRFVVYRTVGDGRGEHVIECAPACTTHVLAVRSWLEFDAGPGEQPAAFEPLDVFQKHLRYAAVGVREIVHEREVS
jgi:hypothetical protein